MNLPHVKIGGSGNGSATFAAGAAGVRGRDALTDLVLATELPRALAGGEFEVWFQPQLSTQSGRTVAAEALLRWRHPQRGLLQPDLFIPIAEKMGLIGALGEWVLHQTCACARQWGLGKKLPLRLAVNLSASQLRGQTLVATVRSILQHHAVDATSLEIELTESSAIRRPQESIAVLSQLREMGVTVALDDFGTGYSSLTHMRQLPLDKLKIDRSFIRELRTDSNDEAIVRAIVSLAQSVGLQVVAEGVETEEQLCCVRALGCDHWQGYFSCPPQPARIFGHMLAAEFAACAALDARGT